MNVICADGTRLECTSFETTDAGVLLFDESDDEASGSREATGFVPITELRYVLPDDVSPGPQPGGAAQRQPGQQASQPPGMGGRQAQGPPQRTGGRQAGEQRSGGQQSGGQQSSGRQSGSRR